MLRNVWNPVLYRITLWFAAAILAVSVLFFWNGGLARVVEYLNDLFLLNFNY